MLQSGDSASWTSIQTFTICLKIPILNCHVEKQRLADDFCRKICSEITKCVVSNVVCPFPHVAGWYLTLWQQHHVLPAPLKVYGQKLTQYNVFCRLLPSCNCVKGSTAWTCKEITWSAFIYKLICLCIFSQQSLHLSRAQMSMT